MSVFARSTQRIIRSLTMALGMLAVSAPARPQSITVTPVASPLPVAATFDGANINHAGILYFPGGAAGESFPGQTVTEVGGFEIVAGIPSNPLTLLTPGANDGVWCYQDELQGVANGTTVGDIGEGAISFFLQHDHSSIGIDINKTDSGTVVMQFFSRVGSPFQIVTLSTGIGAQSYTFTANAGSIAGVTITNSDPSGISVDNLRLQPAASCSLRNGTGVNPVQFSCSTLPVLGTTWLLDAAANSSSIWTFALLSFSPSSPVPMYGGEVLISPPAASIPGFGVHALNLPNTAVWNGIPVFLQGFRIDAPGGIPQVVLLNAIDAVLGI
jgi:hypothetical protein